LLIACRLLCSDPVAAVVCCPLQACISGKFLSSSSATTDTCQNCAAGTFSGSTTGATVCNNCLAGTYSLSSAQSCTSCAANYATSTDTRDSVATCACNAGYYGPAATGGATTITCTVMSPGRSCCCVRAHCVPMVPVVAFSLLCSDPAPAHTLPSGRAVRSASFAIALVLHCWETARTAGPERTLGPLVHRPARSAPSAPTPQPRVPHLCPRAARALIAEKCQETPPSCLATSPLRAAPASRHASTRGPRPAPTCPWAPSCCSIST
jgi:hypothetical protein